MRGIAGSFLGLLACVEHGSLPTTCEADFTLAATPVSSVMQFVTATADQPVAFCLRLESSDEAPTLLLAQTVNDAQQLTLRSVAGTELAAGTTEVSLELPPTEVRYLVLEIRVQPPIGAAGAIVTLDFFALQ